MNDYYYNIPELNTKDKIIHKIINFYKKYEISN